MDAGECVRLSVQGIVAEEFEQGAMIRIATGFREHVDLGALMPELGGINTDSNFELLNGLDRGKHDIGIEIRVGVVDAVEGVVVEHDALPAGGYGLGGAVAALPGPGLTSRRRERVHIGRQPDKAQVLAPFRGSSVMILFSTTAPTVAVSACSRSAVAATSTVSLTWPTWRVTSRRTTCCT